MMMITLMTNRAIWVTQLFLFSAGTSTVADAGSQNWSALSIKICFNDEDFSTNIHFPLMCFFCGAGSEGRLRAVRTRVSCCRPSSSLPVIANPTSLGCPFLNRCHNCWSQREKCPTGLQCCFCDSAADSGVASG